MATCKHQYGALRLITVPGLLLVATIAAAAPQDLSGVWVDATAPAKAGARTPESLFEGPDEFEPPGGEPQLREPYASQYKALQEKKRRAAADGKPLADSRTRCLPLGMPTMMLPLFPIEIVQTRGKVIVLAEELAQIRRIYLNEKAPPLQDIVPGYSGYSVGRWEGSTLIVETRGVREDVMFWDMPHSAEMRLLEQLRLLAPDKLEDRITIDDPEVLAKPYVLTFAYRRDRTYKVSEYVCDNNRYRFDSEGGASLDTNPAR